MCGICGEYAFAAKAPSERDILTMRDALSHRGPDDAGIHLDGPLGLGHRRLSIVDLSPLGRQPMPSQDGRFWITFNGEIYNHGSIRQDLAREGVSFRGGSDTETAVNAASLFGVEESLRRFIGMYALAFWDSREQRLYLCRDRVGVKPLYYCIADGRLLFASEIRAFLAHSRFKAELDRASLGDYLSRGYFRGEATIFKSVRKLPPGCLLSLGPEGAPEITRYWSLDTVRRGAFQGGFAQASEALRELCKDAFGLRLMADVPVGHFLSGGVDSSLVAAVLKKEVKADITNFSLGFTVPEFDESGAAKAISERLSLRLRLRHSDPALAVAELDGYCDVFDEPFGDPSGIPTSILCKFAAEEVKVALSADGGDEQFCGYTGHARYPALYQRLSGIPLPLRQALGYCLGNPATRAALKSHLAGKLLGLARKPHRAALLGKFQELLAARGPAEIIELYQRKGFNRPEALGLAGLPPERPKSYPEAHRNLSPAELTDQLMRQDFATWLPDDILFKVDRASMHASLESRDPLLDHRIAEFAFSLPLEYLCGQGQQKLILRQLLSGYIGESLAKAPKKGFEIPLYAWLKGPWQELTREMLGRESLIRTGLLDPELAGREVRDFYAEDGRDPVRIWLMLNLQMWAKRWWKA